MTAIKTGYSALDQAKGGICPGDLWLIAGAAGQGKSLLMLNLVYNAAMQGKNVMVAVNEMLHAQYRTRLYIRHSRNPKFGLAQGIPYEKFRQESGAEKDSLDKILAWVISDMESQEYGKIGIIQAIEPKDVFQIDISPSVIQGLFVDSLQLLGNGPRKEQQGLLLAEAKRWAIIKEIPLITTWQLGHPQFKAACATGVYDLSSLEIPEAQALPDMIVSVLRRDQETEQSELRCQIVKNRDGESGQGFPLFEDFQTFYVGDMAGDRK